MLILIGYCSMLMVITALHDSAEMVSPKHFFFSAAYFNESNMLLYSPIHWTLVLCFEKGGSVGPVKATTIMLKKLSTGARASGTTL